MVFGSTACVWQQHHTHRKYVCIPVVLLTYIHTYTWSPCSTISCLASCSAIMASLCVTQVSPNPWGGGFMHVWSGLLCNNGLVPILSPMPHLENSLVRIIFLVVLVVTRGRVYIEITVVSNCIVL